MLDHAGFRVTDYQRSKTFHELALAPLGIMLLMEAMGEAAAFGQEGKPFFWIEERPPVPLKGKRTEVRLWTPRMLSAARRSRVSTTSRVSFRPSKPSGPNVSSFQAYTLSHPSSSCR